MMTPVLVSNLSLFFCRRRDLRQCLLWEEQDDGNRDLTEKLEIIPPDKSDTPAEEKIKRAMMEDDFSVPPSIMKSQVAKSKATAKSRTGSPKCQYLPLLYNQDLLAAT